MPQSNQAAEQTGIAVSVAQAPSILIHINLTVFSFYSRIETCVPFFNFLHFQLLSFVNPIFTLLLLLFSVLNRLSESGHVDK